jgi:hypothetical protein
MKQDVPLALIGKSGRGCSFDQFAEIGRISGTSGALGDYTELEQNGETTGDKEEAA